MIPFAQITQWRQAAPWIDNIQVEQDLILSRIIVDIFSDPLLRKELAFRGGTALNKLFFKPAARYSEDIDLVRTSTGAITEIIDALRNRLDPWLGEPQRERKENGFKLRYIFNPEGSPSIRQKIKIEINTRECFTVYDRVLEPFSVQSSWFSGEALVNTYQLEELMATKLRALYQRRKGRDLFDLWFALQHQSLDPKKIIHAFEHYMRQENKSISRELFGSNLDQKLETSLFMQDIDVLLSPILKNKTSVSTEAWNMLNAAQLVKSKLLAQLPSSSTKNSKK